MRKLFLFPAALATVVATLSGAAQATSTTCTTSAVCAEYINTYSGTPGGVAIHGEANAGIGIRGTSVTNVGFYGASGSGTLAAPGVEGESTNSTSMDAAAGFGLASLTGTAGTSGPRYGIEAYSPYAAIAAETTAAGTSKETFGVGVAGVDYGNGHYNYGVAGESNNAVGGLFEAGGGTPTLSEYGTYPIALYAIGRPAQNGLGIGILSESPSLPLYVQNTNSNTFGELAGPSYLLYAGAVSTGPHFFVNDSGNAFLSGTLTTSGGTYVRRGGSGTKRTAYGAQTTTPQIEDVGEGTLVDGRGIVKIDPDLADSIDMHRAYHVFLTPEGDCKGLYVTQKSPDGFVVRELQGGRSSLAFEYRVVAKPVDEAGERLARAIEPSKPPIVGTQVAPAPPFVSPEQRLKERLGPVGYAKAIAELSRRLTQK